MFIKANSCFLLLPKLGENLLSSQCTDRVVYCFLPSFFTIEFPHWSLGAVMTRKQSKPTTTNPNPSPYSVVNSMGKLEGIVNNFVSIAGHNIVDFSSMITILTIKKSQTLFHPLSYQCKDRQFSPNFDSIRKCPGSSLTSP